MNKHFPILLLVSFCLATNAFGATIFTNFYNFSPLIETNVSGVDTNMDGAQAEAGLIISGDILYGTTSAGGTNGTGTIFKINTDGPAFTVLHQFDDGGTPVASLVLSGNSLFGTTENGGTNGTGSIFEIGTNGLGFTNLYSFTALAETNALGDFTNGDGANPTAGLTLIGSALYGTASAGGNNGNGSIFEIGTNGLGFTNLYSFTALAETNALGDFTNSDGATPTAALAAQGNVLYGTTEFGGSGGNGTVFGINPDGTGFTNLYSFSALINLTNADGADVFAGVTCEGAELYGTTLAGGTNGNGTLFAVSANGGGYTNLYTFSATVNLTNLDGAKPAAGLALIGNSLYGTTQLGGTGGSGTVFSISTNGLNFENLYNFSAVSSGALGVPTNSDGDFPQGALVMSQGSFYGTTLDAGTGGNGGIYVFSLGPIPLQIQSINKTPVMTWGNPAFSLMEATNVNGTYTAVPGATSPYTNNLPY
ncbi:MAG: choice-of-anchor tandem repeat GloVer-containing protein [Limisphaerales bacterium]